MSAALAFTSGVLVGITLTVTARPVRRFLRDGLFAGWSR